MYFLPLCFAFSLFVRRPGHASVTSTSDAKDGWKQNNLAQSQQSPVGGHLDVIPFDR